MPTPPYTPATAEKPVWWQCPTCRAFVGADTNKELTEAAVEHQRGHADALDVLQTIEERP